MNDELTDKVERIFERAKHEALALVVSAGTAKPDGAEPSPEWLTDVELARYWRLFNRDGEPVTAGIRAWAKRPPAEFPLPHAYMGDLLRFRREDADRWAVAEAERRRAEAERRKLRPAS